MATIRKNIHRLMDKDDFKDKIATDFLEDLHCSDWWGEGKFTAERAGRGSYYIDSYLKYDMESLLNFLLGFFYRMDEEVYFVLCKTGRSFYFEQVTNPYAS